MRKYLPLLLIVLAAALLRFYGLGQNPPSLDWDEASLGWNAYSLLKTGTEEYGKAWPVSIRSFNDYKPPLYVYAAVPSLALFGKTEFAIRFPSALAGVLTVLLTFFLVRELTKDDLLSFCTSALLALSPWSIQFSRVAFETNLALFFFVLGATLLAYFLNRLSLFCLLSSIFSFVLSIYTYHSSRLVVPFFLAGVALYYRRTVISHWKVSLLSSLFFLVLLYPLVRNTLHVGSLQARFDTVSIFASDTAKHNPAALPALFAKNYLDHFNFDFLFLTGDSINRHHAPDMGVLYLVEAPFLLAGIFFLAKNKPKWLFFVLWWFLSAPVASAITMTTPHAVRSLLFLPTFQIFTAYGFLELAKQIRQQKLLLGYSLAVVGFLSVNVFYFLHQYFVHLPIEYAPAWQYGYKQMVQKVLTLENRYDRVYITSAYDQPYIYFLFYGRISPIIKNDGYFYKGLDKYQFSLDFTDKKGLYVWLPKDQAPAGVKLNVLNTISFPDGAPAFLIGTIQSS